MPTSLRDRISRTGLGRYMGLLLLIAAELIVFSLLSPNFLSLGNLLSFTRLNAEIGLIALGMAIVIASGGIDLSVGAILALSSVVLGTATASGMGMWPAVCLAVAAGIVCGLINGILVVGLRLHPLLVTLGTLSVFRGIALGVSGGKGFSGYPDEFAIFGQAYAGVIPVQTITWIAIAVVLGVVVATTPLGRSLLFIGTSAEPARLSGIRVDAVKVGVYALSGLLCGLASVVYTSRVFSSRGDSGNGLELLAIAAVVVGGASIRGGEISIVRTVLATIAIGLIANGFVLGRLDTNWQYVAVGTLMVVLVVFNELPALRRLIARFSPRSSISPPITKG